MPSPRPARREILAIESRLKPQRPVQAIALPLAPAIDPAPALAIAAAPASGAGDIADIALSYRRAITARLKAQRRYPAAPLRKGWQGTGSLVFRIDREGHLLSAEIVAGTGHALLDDAARAIVTRAAPFPPIPEGLPDELILTLPVAFLLDHGALPADAP